MIAVRFLVLIVTPLPETSRAISFTIGTASLIKVLKVSKARPTPPKVIVSAIANMPPAPVNIRTASARVLSAFKKD